MFKGCIFDLDGTLADTVESIAKAGNRTLEQLGYEKRPVKDYEIFAGDGLRKTIERALQAAGDKEAVNLEEGLSLAQRYFAEDPMYHVKPFPGVVETLEQLKSRGCKLAVLSNKPHFQAIEVVNKIFGKDMFYTIQGQEDKVPRKPDPTGALMIARRWNYTSRECLYIGDTNTDMETGTRAGMYKVGVTWGFRPQKELEDNGADYIIHHPWELLKIQEEVR